jgi:protein ImuB
MMKRVMCVYLPRWPLQRFLHERTEARNKPVVIAQSGPAGRAKILWCCERAARAGVRSGMPVAEGRAMEPSLAVYEEDPPADTRALRKLAAWAERYSPTVGLEENPRPECLLLDITGCAPYFHGEERLAQRALAEFGKEGWKVRIAVSDTVGAAWGLAHHVENYYVAPPGEIENILLPLPVAALRLPEETLENLLELGIERIGQLVELPRAGLPGRFGSLVIERLDQALGRLVEPIISCRFGSEVQVRCSFEYPTERREVLHHALEQLLDRLVEMLRERHRGAKHLECCFYHEAAAPVRIDVQLFRPSRSAVHLGKLLHARLEHIRMDEPVSGIRLRVPVVEVMPERQFELFDAEEPREEELSALIDRLVSRLGREAVTFASVVPDPQPEYACRFDPTIAKEVRSEGRGTRGAGRRVRSKKREAGDEEQWVSNSSRFSSLTSRPLTRRPVQVWPVPEPLEILALAQGLPAHLRRCGKEYTVQQAWGPERIETGWWRGQDIHRDYYIVETAAGTRWWIFRRHDDGRWFLHGCFD